VLQDLTLLYCGIFIPSGIDVVPLHTLVQVHPKFTCRYLKKVRGNLIYKRLRRIPKSREMDICLEMAILYLFCFWLSSHSTLEKPKMCVHNHGVEAMAQSSNFPSNLTPSKTTMGIPGLISPAILSFLNFLIFIWTKISPKNN
jgi:hypothetical protein